MRARFISQPLGNDGSHQTLGETLRSLLGQEEITYTDIWLISAWVTRRAFLRLSSEIERHKNAGSNIKINFGVDLQGTSIEAAKSILQFGVASKIVFNRRASYTFHPKIYLFEAEGSRADLFLGSNNLTDGGMYTNYEACTWLSYDLASEEESYLATKDSLDLFLNPPDNISSPLSEDLITLLSRANILVSERTRRNRNIQSDALPREPIELPFEAVYVPPAPPIGQHLPLASELVPAIHPDNLAGLEVLWRKSDLPGSDVQRSPSGNPTGGLRLTQAHWTKDGQPIDQTTFFREVLFGQEEWSVGIHEPIVREATRIPFEVVILGNNYGIQELTVSHKPGGEAGQRNYTTIIHWGHLSETIQALNLVERTFEIKRNPTSDIARYVIQIS